MNTKNILRKAVARFVDNELVPVAREIDEENKFPRKMFEEIGNLGYFAIRYPKEYGGAGHNVTLFCIVCEELARGSMAVAAITAMQCLMGTNFIYQFGTEDQKKRLLIPAIRGKKVAAFAMTEPEAASDLLGGLRTTAQKTDKGFVLNGMKTWITNAPYADFFTVLCATGKGTDPRKKILDFFIVEKDTPGLSISLPFKKMGTHGVEIAEICFDNCCVPFENRLGLEGTGRNNYMTIAAEIRTMTAALSLGLARAAYDAAFQYAKERMQFGRPISKFQAMKMKLARMATDIEVSKLLLYDTTKKLESGKNCMKEAAMAKYFISEVAQRAADDATRILASYSYSMEYPVQRFFRDARFLLFGGGTTEILLSAVIAKEIGL